MNMKLLKQKGIVIKSGFTLVEALVAISILMIAIASPMSLAQKGLSSATLSKNQMIASFLAQDAVEAVKNIRDQIAVSQTTGDWLDNTVLEPCVCRTSSGDTCSFDATISKFCKIDTTSPIWNNSSIKSAGVAANPQLSLVYTPIDTSGIKHFLKYSYDTFSGVEATIFKRYINIVKTSDTVAGGDPNEAVINVRVIWTSPQGPQKIDVQDFIYNYSENL